MVAQINDGGHDNMGYDAPVTFISDGPPAAAAFGACPPPQVDFINSTLTGAGDKAAYPGSDLLPAQVQLVGDYDDKKSKQDIDSSTIPFKDLSCCGKTRFILSLVGRILCIVLLLYLFIISLDLLSSSFILLGGRTAGVAFQSPLLKNPLCGLMIGVVATAFLQSSSTSTSIVITMVAANLITVQVAIPIIMGANIGTSITGILVASTQASNREQFRLAFTAATIHDMFNWLSVLILLPIEVATGYLFHLTTAIVRSSNLGGGGQKQEFLKVITKPLSNLIVQVDKKVMEDTAAGVPGATNRSLLKFWCKTETRYMDPTYQPPTGTPEYSDVSTTPVPTEKIGIEECRYIFHHTGLSEQAVGGIILIIALALLIFCLIFMVRLLKSLLQGSSSKIITKTINANFPGKASCLTGYAAVIVGAILTVLVQSSSVVVSALTPLVGLGLVDVDRVFPMLIGANIGTTNTAILAAFAASGDRVGPTFQIALCHLFFNLTAFLIWYPIPAMRKIPLGLARFFGNVTAKYRWFAIMYILVLFILLPATIFGLSIPGWQVLAGVLVPVAVIAILILFVKLMQHYCPLRLPVKLRTWKWLSECMRSLRPMDACISKIIYSCFCCKRCRSNEEEHNPQGVIVEGNITDVNSNEKFKELENMPYIVQNGDIYPQSQRPSSQTTPHHNSSTNRTGSPIDSGLPVHMSHFTHL